MDGKTFDPPFPREALMGVIGGATRFIHLTNLAPFESGACSVLAACAVVCQTFVNVRWKAHGTSPTGLYIVNEGVSGERKSVNDLLACPPYQKFEADQSALKAEAVSAYVRDMALWEQKVKQLTRMIAKCFTKGKCTADAESRLADLVSEKPQMQKFAEFFVENLTPQALAHHLGSVYPYGGLFSDEGATVFSGGAMRDVGMLNKLWEAGVWKSDRITRGRTELRNARFTFFVQVQPDILNDYLERQGMKFHGSGLSSRFLFASPASRQGKRFPGFDEIRPEDIEPHYARIRELLNRCAGPVPPEPGVLEFSKAASALLIWFQCEIEKELGEGGRFFHMRGAASKITENCARLAAILHTMEKMEGPITVEVLRNAIKLAAWFLNQYRLRFCPRSQLELDMITLEEFITDRAAPRFAKERAVPGTYFCRYAPRHLRPVDRLWDALKALESRGKLKIWGDKGKAWHVHLVDWFPPPPLPTAAPADPYSLRPFTRWDRQVHQPAPPEPEVPVAWYELWPGVFLK